MYAFVWLGAISGADLIQIILITHVLGLTEYGRLALVTSFVVLVAQFLDVRVSYAATTFGTSAVVSRQWRLAAGTFRFTYLIDATTGLLAFLIVVALAPVIGPRLVGDDGAWLIVLFGISLLASTVDDSSISVTRLMGKFRLLAQYTVALEIFRIIAIACALILEQSLASVLAALVIYEVVSGFVNYMVAASVFSRASGTPLVRLSLETFSEQRALLRTAMHTNVVSYARIAQAQLPVLLLGIVTTPLSVGLYKVGAAAAALVGRVGDPASLAVLPRLSRLWSTGQLVEIRRLVKGATIAVGPFVAITLAVLVIFREPVLRLIGGPEAVDAVPVLVLIAVAQAINAFLFWDTGLLFAARRSGAVSVVAVVTTGLQLVMLFPLAERFDEAGAALSLLVTTTVANIALVMLCHRVLEAKSADA